jgi:3-phosphoshikimate 1-carboxyvinyltransferase
MTQIQVIPGHSLSGQFGLRTSPAIPGDKSISHRTALLAAMAEGTSTIRNFMVSGVTQVLLNALTEMGVSWSLEGESLTISSPGILNWQPPQRPINCGNSATTIRLLAGAIAAAGIPAILDGSESLRQRPMDRIVEPLSKMGVPIKMSATKSAPLILEKRNKTGTLNALAYDLPISSAQVKTCILLAALAAKGTTRLTEPNLSRDHTERLFSGMGIPITNEYNPEYPDARNKITMPGGGIDFLKPLDITLPGDFSSAAFMIVSALISPRSHVELIDVGLNPTRSGLLDVLKMMGADINIYQTSTHAGEPTGNLIIKSSVLNATNIHGDLVTRMIDEFPIFSVAAAYAQGQSTVRDAEELRFKETDRIHSVCVEFKKIGVEIKETQDGFIIDGSGVVPGGTGETHRDHRLAMSLVVAGLAAQNPILIHNAEIINESFPAFTKMLTSAGAVLEIINE